jgi:uncharacterized membrane protein
MELSKQFVGYIIMVLLDFTYINFVKSHWIKDIDHINKKPFTVTYSRLFWLWLVYKIIYLGIFYFIIKENKTPTEALYLGLYVYSIFNMTTLIFFDNWSITRGLLDTLWGGILFYLTTYTIQGTFKRKNKIQASEILFNFTNWGNKSKRK